MSIYVALTQIKIPDESGLQHTASHAELRRRTIAAADVAARAAMAIPAARDSYTPFRIRVGPPRRWRGHHPARAWRNPARAWRTGRINLWRTSLAALAPKARAGGYAAQAACQRSSSDPVSSA